MYRRVFTGVALCAIALGPLQALAVPNGPRIEPVLRQADPPAYTDIAYVFQSHDVTRHYALWIAAPEAGCRKVRYEIRVDDRRRDISPPLKTGDGVVLSVGAGLQPGPHEVTVRVHGCAKPPDSVRRVIRFRQSHDHSWRASLLQARN